VFVFCVQNEVEMEEDKGSSVVVEVIVVVMVIVIIVLVEAVAVVAVPTIIDSENKFGKSSLDLRTFVPTPSCAIKNLLTLPSGIQHMKFYTDIK